MVIGALGAFEWPRFGLILSRPDELPSMGRDSLAFFRRFCGVYTELLSVFSNFDFKLIKRVWSMEVPREVMLLHCCWRLPGRWSAREGATESYYVVLAEARLFLSWPTKFDFALG